MYLLSSDLIVELAQMIIFSFWISGCVVHLTSSPNRTRPTAPNCATTPSTRRSDCLLLFRNIGWVGKWFWFLSIKAYIIQHITMSHENQLICLFIFHSGSQQRNKSFKHRLASLLYTCERDKFCQIQNKMPKHRRHCSTSFVKNKGKCQNTDNIAQQVLSKKNNRDDDIRTLLCQVSVFYRQLCKTSFIHKHLLV